MMTDSLSPSHLNPAAKSGWIMSSIHNSSIQYKEQRIVGDKAFYSLPILRLVMEENYSSEVFSRCLIVFID
jgi:hypothetical protein